MENLEQVLDKIVEKLDDLDRKVNAEPERKLISRSESITEIAKAFVKFQAEVKNPFNSTENSFFGNKYATLADVLNEVRPVMAKHGLSILQIPSIEKGMVCLTTLLLHESGEWIEPDPLMMSVEKQNAQGIGSSLTYARRYSISAILGVASEDDDDGNEASQPGKKPTPKPAKKTPTKTKPSENPKESGLKEMIDEATEKAKTLQAAGVDQKEIMEVFRLKGYPNPNTIPSVEIGKSIMEELNKLG